MSLTQGWKPIEPLAPSQTGTDGRVAAVDALRDEWTRQLLEVSEEDRKRRRQRTLRQLAVETGIIERLYDIEWGLTLTLVAEGFTRDVIARSGGRLDDSILATLNAQRDSLEMVIDFVQHKRTLSASFIKELHHACTRTQTTYIATDLLGQVVERELPHGKWRQWSNRVERQDGSVLEYCPPEHVDSEIDNLTRWYEILEETPTHPMVKAAWLHHRFVQIHPFADGNGRVARALTVLVMQRHKYAPLVVDRFHRAEYLRALDRANDEDLQPLVALFSNLESSALASELESAITPQRGTATKVARTLAAQLSARRDQEQQQRRTALDIRSFAVGAMASHWIKAKGSELIALFAEQGINDVRVSTFETSSATPEYPNGEDDLPRHLWFKRQVINSARRAGHYADFGGHVALSTLRVQVRGTKLSFVVSIHGAGVGSGVLALTTFATIRLGSREDGSSDDIDVVTSSDAFRAVHSEQMEALNQRKAELDDLLDEALSIALVELMKYV
jgi:fido (protein-threonine AMPylation protein)